MTSAHPGDQSFAQRTFGALRTKNYAVLLGGTFISQSGSWLHATAIQILLAQLTEDPFLVGLVVFCQFFPSLGLGLVGGAMADRFDRRRIICVMNAVELALTAALAVLFALGLGSLTVIFLITTGLGVAVAIVGPAWFSFYPTLVPARDLPSAVSLNAMQFNLARVLGPTLGGFLVAFIGPAGTIGLNSLSFLALLVPLVVLSFPRATKRRSSGSGLHEIIEGFRYVARHRWLQAVLVTVVVQALFAAQIITLMSTLGTLDLGLGAGRVGLLFAAFGFGGVPGALAASNIVYRFGRRRLVPFLIGAVGVMLVVVSIQNSFVAILLTLFPTGAVYIGAMSSMNVLMQVGVDDDVRGRVSSMWFTIFVGIFPAAALGWGAVARVTSTRFTLLVGGTICVVYALALFTARVIPKVT